MTGQPRPTILVVDNDDGVRTLVSTTLAGANFGVLEARGGIEGVSTMHRYAGDIALAVVEIQMPGMGGLDLANEIAGERPNTEILYTSTLTTSVATESIARAKPEAVLAKPFTAEQLLARVRLCVSGATAKSA